MKLFLASCFIVVLPGVSVAQTKEIQDAIEAKLATTRFVLSLENPNGGFRAQPSDPRKDQHLPTSIGATSAAVRALKYLGATVPNAEKHAAFIMTCYDPQTGGFADTPGGKPNVFTTSVGVMAAMELKVPKEKFAKAMTFIKDNAMSFEDVRIGAAAVEAWGVKDCPFEVKPWITIAEKHFVALGYSPPQEGGARDAGSLVPFLMRVGGTFGTENMKVRLQKGQRADGAWGKSGEEVSDLETTYRVMRAFYMLNEAPKDIAKLREFIAKCRNTDGGYGVSPGQPSIVGPVYYATIITHWLDGMEKK